MRTNPVRKGFSLVELIVSLLIVVILLALLLPALGRARESARRIACQSNLRQFTLASLMLSDALRRLPESRIQFDDDTMRLSKITSLWGDMLLKTTRSVSADGTQFSPASSFCPSAIEKETIRSFPVLEWNPNASESSDFRGNMGFIGWDDEKGPFSVLPESHRHFIDSEITDGKSSTIYGWETIGSRIIYNFNINGGTGGISVRFLKRGGGEDIQRIPLLNDYVKHIEPCDSCDFARLYHGIDGFGAGFIYSVFLPRVEGAAQIRALNFTSDYGAPYSRHGAIVNMSFADGSIRTVDDKIEYFTLLLLGCMNDDELVELED